MSKIIDIGSNPLKENVILANLNHFNTLSYFRWLTKVWPIILSEIKISSLIHNRTQSSFSSFVIFIYIICWWMWFNVIARKVCTYSHVSQLNSVYVLLHINHLDSGKNEWNHLVQDEKMSHKLICKKPQNEKWIYFRQFRSLINPNYSHQ